MKIICALLFSCLFSGCKGKNKEPFFTYSIFLMNVPASVTVYTPDENLAGKISDAVFEEWNRIAREYSFSEPYSLVSYLNRRASMEPVKVEEEFYRLLTLSMDYYNLTKGAFDITFAPLWPIWKEAAASKKMPAKEEIRKALQDIGSNHIHINHAKRTVKFTKPVQINMGGILRSYCFTQGYKILKNTAGNSFPVELRLGGYMLAYGKRNWVYEVQYPFNDKKSLGKFVFDQGVVLSSSGRDKFVQIEGKIYSHIIDLKTGYPLEDFSNLIVYFKDIEGSDFMPSVILALMGKDDAFKLLSKMKGTAAIWIDGQGRFEIFENENSGAGWIKSKKIFNF
ncbi:MAG: FAD:protein FMN transferase [Elusimicrobia bacterium]|nr:FAD:protein FMN transferase [Elusimicrobiota bacterium]